MQYKWTDVYDIAIDLAEKYPDVDPYSVNFVELHGYVTHLPGFVDDPDKSNEKILEAIQTAWDEEIS